jgi:hypothetical protein
MPKLGGGPSLLFEAGMGYVERTFEVAARMAGRKLLGDVLPLGSTLTKMISCCEFVGSVNS